MVTTRSVITLVRVVQSITNNMLCFSVVGMVPKPESKMAAPGEDGGGPPWLERVPRCGPRGRIISCPPRRPVVIAAAVVRLAWLPGAPSDGLPQLPDVARGAAPRGPPPASAAAPRPAPGRPRHAAPPSRLPASADPGGRRRPQIVVNRCT